jgi:hypothetical protein
MGRSPLPTEIQDQILLLSRRRCCICFGLNGDLTERQGQIAHLDHDPANNAPDNLAFLCLPCHDRYDGKTSQSKALRLSEVKQYRKELYDRIAAGLPGEPQPIRLAIPAQQQDETLPNVGSLRPEIAVLTYHRASDIFRRTNLLKELEDETDAVQAVLLPFSNDPQPKKKTLPVQDVKARLTYYKGDEVHEFKRIDNGCWVGQRYPFITLEVGGIIYLIASLSLAGHGACVESAAPSLIFNETSLSPDHLPDGKYELKVSLMAGEHGEYSADFWFEVEIGEQLKCKRIMPR